MHALRHDILSPSGVEFAVALNLTPSTSSTLVNVVTAKSNLLRVYGIREQPSPIFDHVESERDRRAHVRKGTEAVEGEVEMDQSGEGWVNVGAVKVSARCNPSSKTFSKGESVEREPKNCNYVTLPSPSRAYTTWNCHGNRQGPHDVV